MKKDKLDYILANRENAEKLTKVSRRDLLAAGAIPFIARLASPTALSLVAQLLSPSSALSAANNVTDAWIPFINVNLSGGASLCASFIALDQGKNLLDNYSRLGLGTTPSVETYMGVPMDKRSHFLKGLKTIVSGSAALKTKAVTFCTNTDADTGAIESLRPQFDLTPQIEVLGSVGKYFSSLNYNPASTSIRTFHTNAPLSKVAVSNISDVINSVVLTSKYADTKISDRQVASLLKTITQLSKNYLNQNQNLKDKSVRVDAALDSVNNFLGTAEGTTPAQLLDTSSNSTAMAVYSGGTVQDKAVSAVVCASLNGYSSASSIHLGGYDYHVPTRSISDNADYNAGLEVGRIIEVAHRLNKPVFIFLCTDGANLSADSEDNTSPWTGDTRSSTQVVFAYHPAGVKPIKSGDMQVGYYNNVAVPLAELNTLVGNRSDYVAAAVMANYLSLHDKLNLFGKAVPSTLDAAKIDEAVKISL